MFQILTFRRLSVGRWLKRSAAALLLVALLLPNFACRCGDGVEIPYCVPGTCSRCQVHNAGASEQGHPCCAKAPQGSCCGHTASHSSKSSGCGVSSGGPCCQLVIHSQSESSPPQKVQFELHQPLTDFCAIEALPGLAPAFVPNWQRPLDPERGPPPLDFVIAHQHLTL